MFIVYDIIFILFAFFYLPFMLFAGKMHRGLWQRLGVFKRQKFSERPIWIHAVSVGEVGVASLLVKALKQKINQPSVVSVVTQTGHRLAEKLIGEDAKIIYAPVDISFIVNRFLKLVSPHLFILLETELWPNLINALYKRKVPIALINGRISPHSLRGYSQIKFLTQRILEKINLFCMQTKEDKRRIITLGARPERVEVTGNMKFDNVDYAGSETGLSGYNLKLWIKSDELLFIAGSTHPPEEKIILGVYKNLLSDFANLRLLIAPRHIERADEIERLVAKFGFNTLRMSDVTYHLSPITYHQILLLDTIGQLKQLYKFASVVFIGGTLIKKGGQNILEAAFFAKPVVFGTYMFNFSEIASLYLSNNAAIQVKSKEELEQAVRRIFNNTQEASAMGARAKEIIYSQKGATSRNVDLIMGLMK